MSSRRPENPDLKAERKKCTFNTLELTFLLDGGRAKTKERRLIGKYQQNWSLRTRELSSPPLVNAVQGW
jgi:hypothetical protein